ncbi:hypothetical protein GGI43DRAFT_116536 [Trichoderma evansii]
MGLQEELRRVCTSSAPPLQALISGKGSSSTSAEQLEAHLRSLDQPAATPGNKDAAAGCDQRDTTSCLVPSLSFEAFQSPARLHQLEQPNMARDLERKKKKKKKRKKKERRKCTLT